MTFDFTTADALTTAEAIRSQKITAIQTVNAALKRIAERDKTLNCFTYIATETALKEAAEIDKKIANKEETGPLSGVPFAVKNLFDIKNIPTLAGSKINQQNPPANQDATAITRLKAAGAILVGALNMDEYAYGFVTENEHYGATHNPHDITRVAGGSSGGSAAAVAAGLVPITLGSDTNGSIRVPASFCGIYGLKPTYGRLSRSGVFLFSNSLDHIGPFARSVRDISAIFDILQGQDSTDPICTNRTPEPTLPQLNLGIENLKIAVAGNYFNQSGEPEIFAAVEKIANALNVKQTISIPEAHRARAAAFIITACEGSNLHFHNLKTRPQDFDFATRDRFLAGAFIPSGWYLQAQRFRRWFQTQVREIFQNVDIILAPTTPCPAPKIGQTTMILDGEEMLIRPHLGLYTQPLSFIGLPVLSVPVQRQNALPLGVQIIAAPYNEALILRVAAVLENMGIISAPVV
ncbi:MAG TPA: AtzE family amidohydrolase [Halomicronema sp.]